MQTAADAASRARTILETDHQAVGRMRELLLVEREAIGARDITRLGEAVQHKLECLQQLERNDQERKKLIAQSGSRDWDGLLQTLDPALMQLWQSLRSRLGEVAEITEANEKIVNRTRRSTSRLLALLRGQGENTQGVYDRSGRTLSHGDNRAITSA